MSIDIKDFRAKVEAITLAQSESTRDFENGREKRINELRDLISSVNITGVEDDNLEEFVEEINDVLYDSGDDFQGRIYAFERRNKLLLEYEEWLSSHC